MSLLNRRVIYGPDAAEHPTSPRRTSFGMAAKPDVVRVRGEHRGPGRHSLTCRTQCGRGEFEGRAPQAAPEK